jgi:AcrR family transcriptional regulator
MRTQKLPKLDSHSAIFQAAAIEFSELGFDAAGVDRIAARAGVKKAMH